MAKDFPILFYILRRKSNLQLYLHCSAQQSPRTNAENPGGCLAAGCKEPPGGADCLKEKVRDWFTNTSNKKNVNKMSSVLKEVLS